MLAKRVLLMMAAVIQLQYLPIKCANSELSVLTFNIWVSGENVLNGLEKVAKHIRLINADIVALQEVKDVELLANLTRLVGYNWRAITTSTAYADTAILTRHKVLEESASEVSHGVGARIYVERVNRTFHVWSLHLDYSSYGPYAAFNKMTTDYSQIMAGEMGNGEGRFQNMRELLLNDKFNESLNKCEIEPVIVCGDFNSPSHLDWTLNTREYHGNWDFEWPVTKMLIDEAAMLDSYRMIYPSALTHPGNTWSTVEKMTSTGWQYTIPEPQDRIDFIFYRSSALKPRSSNTYCGHETVYPKPHHFNNDYPSDHYAVISTFIVN